MKKIGFHYFPDTDHYTAADLARWLPKLKQLKASWVVLQAPEGRAIPEAFLQGLKAGGVEPVLHFPFDCTAAPDVEGELLLFEAYARWGVKYVILFDRPNLRQNWTGADWAQSDLVERFLDAYLPLAEAALMVGLTPVFPPLEPGGDYWDTMFLRTALEGIRRRASEPLLKRMLLSACAGFNAKPLSWGAGGPERWPEAQPYQTDRDTPDQRGFRIADWYLTLSETILERKIPLLMLGICGPAEEGVSWEDALLEAADLLAGQENEDREPLADKVIGGAFWLLAAKEGTSQEVHSWYQEDGTPKPAAERILAGQPETAPKFTDEFRISHYLLLPTFDWGVADWHLEVTRAFIKKHRPTVGFSVEEARRSEEVTVLGGEDSFSPAVINELRGCGCLVRRIEGDGTNVASQLAAI